MFQKLSDKNIADFQNQQSAKWEREGLLQKTLDARDKKKSFIFYEGPPTANGIPGIHHVIARALKDSVCRHKTMQGYYVPRKAGWDTHGLPVEIEVEKQLGLFTKKDIEEYGIAKFNEKCRESVFRYEGEWREMSKRMGYLIDMEDPYITLDDGYIESVWWIIKKFFDEGLIYEGHKIMPYCPRCGTGLASHEVAQGYKEVKTLTATALFKRKDADEYFLAWTTTPWTMLSNVALTVGPSIDYIKAKVTAVEGSAANHAGKIVYVAKALADDVIGEGGYETIEEMKGSELEGIEYEQLLPYIDIAPYPKAAAGTGGGIFDASPTGDYIPRGGDISGDTGGDTFPAAFYVTLADYATDTDGTGIVHTAPAFGEDDYNTGKRYNLPVVNPVDEEGKFTDGPWRGHFVLEDGLDVEIIKDLAGRGLLFDKGKVEHNYPFCWRCDTPLIYYSKPGWYIEVTKLKERLIANNKEVKWFPDYVGEKRFENWLENLNDWAISRTRYWGTPIPIWRCEKCGLLKCAGSRAELAELTGDAAAAEIELHRPYVDELTGLCECGGTMRRIPEVMDCWFDSGSMPFAQSRYPFAFVDGDVGSDGGDIGSSDRFDEEFFPADFICEGIDQTRGWFYSLLVIATFVKGKAPYKNVLVNDLILDKDGKKMSKSKGNAVSPLELFDVYGADAVRFYLFCASPAWAPTRFDEDGVREVAGKFFGTLKNVYQFFALYANQDGVDREFFAEKKTLALPALDRFILSKYNKLIREYVGHLDNFDHMRAARAIMEFVDQDLSNWYIRRSRRRFWGAEMTDDKRSVYQTTYEVLRGVALLLAPLAPFISDEIYVKLTGEETVHTGVYPEARSELIDEELTSAMDIARSACNLGRAIREKEKLKVRQPLPAILLPKNAEGKLAEFEGIIKDELNIKEVLYIEDKGEYMGFEILPNFKTAGKTLGKKMKEFKDVLANKDAAEIQKILGKLESDGKFSTVLSGEETEIEREFVEIKIRAKEGYSFEMGGETSGETGGEFFVGIDTELTDDLLDEGLAREFISKVQQIRKAQNLEMMDNIEIDYSGNEKLRAAIEKARDFVMGETLAKSLSFMAGIGGETTINGIAARIEVRKI